MVSRARCDGIALCIYVVSCSPTVYVMHQISYKSSMTRDSNLYWKIQTSRMNQKMQFICWMEFLLYQQRLPLFRHHCNNWKSLINFQRKILVFDYIFTCFRSILISDISLYIFCMPRFFSTSVSQQTFFCNCFFLESYGAFV